MCVALLLGVNRAKTGAVSTGEQTDKNAYRTVSTPNFHAYICLGVCLCVVQIPLRGQCSRSVYVAHVAHAFNACLARAGTFVIAVHKWIIHLLARRLFAVVCGMVWYGTAWRVMAHHRYIRCAKSEKDVNLVRVAVHTKNQDPDAPVLALFAVRNIREGTELLRSR